jgi:AraC-like DNA-binding protein
MNLSDFKLIHVIEEALANGLGVIGWIGKGAVREKSTQLISESTRVVIVLKGTLTIKTSCIESQSFEAGSGFIIASSAWYEITSTEYHLLEVEISQSRVAIYETTHKRQGMNKRSHVLPRTLREEVFVRLEKIMSLLQATSDDREEVKSRAQMLELFLVYVVSLFEADFPKKRKVYRLFEALMACISDNYLCPSFTRMGVAAKFKISESYVNTIIVWGLGCKFKEYLTLKRLEYSRNVLKESRQKIKILVETFGYRDPTIFIINFRKRYKLTPGKMRSLIKKEDISVSEKYMLHHMNMIDELEHCKDLDIKNSKNDQQEKAVLFLSNLTNNDISVFSCGEDSQRFLLSCIPENTRVEVNPPRGSLLEVRSNHQDSSKIYKVAEKPCIVYYS